IAVLDDLRQQRDNANIGLTESKVALASEEQLCASLRQQGETLGERIHELAQVAEQRRNEISACVNRKGQAESEIQESRARIETLGHERQQVNSQAAELLAQKQSR